MRKYKYLFYKYTLFDYCIFVFIFIRLFSSVQGLGTYKSLSVFFPGLSLALLYMTVLSFDSVTRGKYPPIDI